MLARAPLIVARRERSGPWPAPLPNRGAPRSFSMRLLEDAIDDPPAPFHALEHIFFIKPGTPRLMRCMV